MVKQNIVYSLKCNDTNKTYIGSTSSRLCTRKAQHKYHYKLYTQNKFHYIKSFDIIAGGNYETTIIETVENKDDLKKRERYYIENTDNCINKNIPGRTKKEYAETYNEEYYYKNQQAILKQKREYYQKNKDVILKKMKKYRDSKK